MLATVSLLAGIPLASGHVSEREQTHGRQTTSPRGDSGTHAFAVASRSETCRSARRGTWFYLRRANSHRAKRGAHSVALRRPIRKASCSYERWRSQRMRDRARQERRSTERWQRRKRNSIPVGEAALRAYINDDCLEEIVDRETGGTWDPTIDYGFGHGNVNEAYGLPQALPGWKMASAGADWRTNPKTQIRWMRGYVNGRYGGSCGALAHHNANGWY